MIYSNQPQYANFGTLVNQIMQQALSSLVWLEGVISTPSASGNPASLASQANLVLSTLLNGAQIIGGQNTLTGITSDYPLLQQVAALPVAYTSGAAQTINNRLQGLANLQVSLKQVVPTSIMGVASGLLGVGSPAIPDINLMGLYSTWTGEPIPTGYAEGSLYGAAIQNQQNWASVASGVAAYYGNYPQTPLDCAVRAAQGSLTTSTIVSGLSINDSTSSQITPAMVWNGCYALPATQVSARLLAPNLSLDTYQVSMATRSFLLTMAKQVAGFVVLANGIASTALGSAGMSAVITGSQGLMDVAAQNLGSFENWRQMAGAVPAPWGAGALQPGTNIALVSGSIGLTQAQILGSDIDLGQQNQPVPTWTGDFLQNVGIANYRASLGRRLATTLGGLIFHTEYGSRIPPELGQILTQGGLSLITAYGQAAIASDPRTQQVISAVTVPIQGQPNTAGFVAQVQPIGPGMTAVGVNETLSPA